MPNGKDGQPGLWGPNGTAPPFFCKILPRCSWSWTVLCFIFFTPKVLLCILSLNGIIYFVLQRIAKFLTFTQMTPKPWTASFERWIRIPGRPSNSISIYPSLLSIFPDDFHLCHGRPIKESQIWGVKMLWAFSLHPCITPCPLTAMHFSSEQSSNTTGLYLQPDQPSCHFIQLYACAFLTFSLEPQYPCLLSHKSMVPNSGPLLFFHPVLSQCPLKNGVSEPNREFQDSAGCHCACFMNCSRNETRLLLQASG